jgi:hypothetical protein
MFETSQLLAGFYMLKKSFFYKKYIKRFRKKVNRIAAFLCSWSLLILYGTGWLSHWMEAFESTRANIQWVLWTLSLLSLCQPWRVHEHLYIHPAWIGFLLIFIYCGGKFSPDILMTLLSSSFCAGTLFLLGHEWLHAHADWTYPPFRILLLSGVILLSLLISPRLPERIWFAGMSLMALEIWIQYFHQDGFAPVVLGSNVFMDVLWLSLTGILFAHILENHFRSRISKKRLSLSKL